MWISSFLELITILYVLCCTRKASPAKVINKTVVESKLMTDLLSNYDKRIRPILNNSQPLIVSVRLVLYQLLEVEGTASRRGLIGFNFQNEPQQHVDIYAWMREIWYDELLAWDPSSYNGTNQLIVPHTDIWRPDTIIYNSIEMKEEDTKRATGVIVSMNQTEDPDRAKVEYIYPTIIKFTCAMHIGYFPFDHQNCSLTFGSWMYTAQFLEFLPSESKAAMDAFVPNGGWELVSFDCYPERKKYSCCSDPFAIIHFHLVMKRKPLFYLVNLVIPTVIITAVSFVGFFSPASSSGEREEKVSLGITTLLSMSILLLMVSDHMPTSSNVVPLIGWFYLVMIILIASAAIATAVVLQIQQQGKKGKRLPDWVHQLHLKIFKVSLNQNVASFVLSRSQSHRESQNSKVQRSPSRSNIDRSDTRVTVVENGSALISRSVSHNQGMGMGLGGISFIDEDNRNSSGDLGAPLDFQFMGIRALHKKLERLNRTLDKNKDYLMVQEEWEYIADLLERHMLIFFIFISTVFTCSFLCIGFFHT